MKLPKGVFKYLDISTKHVTEEDMKKLAANDTNSEVIAYSYPEGVWVYVPPEFKTKELLDEGFSLGFCGAILKAEKFDCPFLRIDADGTQHDDLLEYDW